MSKEKTKVYLYTRVSTVMQIDGYSLDAQKSKMKAFCEYNDYEIAGEYEDAGKSGKSIEGRIQFNRMLEDINSGRDGVSYVLVFKLSRFGRNDADVLSALQIMQKMSETERRQFYEKLLGEVNIYEERQPNGQWIKSVVFKLPIIEHDMELSLDNDDGVVTVVLLNNKKVDGYIDIDLNL